MVLLPYPGPLQKHLKEAHINFSVVGFPRCVVKGSEYTGLKKWSYTYNYYKKLFFIMPQLKSIVNAFKPDLIYTNTSVVSAGAIVSKKVGLPHVWHIREFGDLDYHFSFIPSKSKIASYILNSSRAMFVSKALKEHWTGSSLKKFSVVYNGIIDESNEKYPARKLNKQKKINFVILGAILPGKGHKTAIEAIAEYAAKNPGILLTIYGNIIDKAYYSELTDLINELGASEIEFKPFTEDKDSIYNNADVLLNCSEMEGFGRTIVEAMERGIPVIANASAGPLEIIDHKVNGLLYQSSVQSLMDNMTWLLSSDENYHLISERSIEKARSNFTVQRYVKAVDEIFESVLEK